MPGARVCGALYSLLRPGSPSLVRGALEGPHSGPGCGHQVTMVIAHWIFGAVVGIVVAARRR